MSKCARCGANFVTAPESPLPEGTLCNYCQITELKEENQHIREWWSSRFKRLEDFARQELRGELCNRFFSIVANGHPDTTERHSYERELVLRDHEIELLKRACSELRELVAVAQPFAARFAADNPKHEWKGQEQDPFGVHEWLEKATRALAKEAIL